MDAGSTGQLIAARRKELGLSQTELAERLHVTDKAVSRWETGRGMPAVDSLEPLGETLGLSVSELLSGRKLTPEELPRAAGGQIVETMKQNGRMLWRGVLAVLLIAAVLLGCWYGYHWFTSAGEQDLEGLTRQARDYHSSQNGLQIVELERRGDYLAALCADRQGVWSLCVFDRDEVFPTRWRGGGGIPGFSAGTLTSWNFGNPREAVIIFCGSGLPEEAAYYSFRNSGITYTCPIENRQVLDVFLLPDNRDISSTPEALLDADYQPLQDRLH